MKESTEAVGALPNVMGVRSQTNFLSHCIADKFATRVGFTSGGPELLFDEQHIEPNGFPCRWKVKGYMFGGC